MNNLNKKIYQNLYSIFSFTIGGFPPNRLEQINKACEDLADSIHKGARTESIRVAKRIQNAIVEAFKSYDKEFERLEKRIKALEGER